MARLEITTGTPTRLLATFSERNLKALAHKLEMPGSAREVHNNDVWIDGAQAPYPGFVLVMSCREGDGIPEFRVEQGEQGFELWVTLPAAAIANLLGGEATLEGTSNADGALAVAVEDDETHYGAREAQAGEMHPDTEAFIAGSAG